MCAKGDSRTWRYKSAFIFDVMTDIKFDVFVSNSENLAACSVECVCYNSCLATYKLQAETCGKCFPCLPLHSRVFFFFFAS
jgi:hypothetical protein